MKTLKVFAVEPDKIIESRRQRFDKELIGLGYWIRFTTPLISIGGSKPEKRTYCYPHDLYLAWIMVGSILKPSGNGPISNTESWDVHGKYSMPTPSIIQMKFLESMFREK